MNMNTIIALLNTFTNAERLIINRLINTQTPLPLPLPIPLLLPHPSFLFSKTQTQTQTQIQFPPTPRYPALLTPKFLSCYISKNGKEETRSKGNRAKRLKK